jgi:hypothetical protein
VVVKRALLARPRPIIFCMPSRCCHRCHCVDHLLMLREFASLAAATTQAPAQPRAAPAAAVAKVACEEKGHETAGDQDLEQTYLGSSKLPVRTAGIAYRSLAHATPVSRTVLRAAEMGGLEVVRCVSREGKALYCVSTVCVSTV